MHHVKWECLFCVSNSIIGESLCIIAGWLVRPMIAYLLLLPEERDINEGKMLLL